MLIELTLAYVASINYVNIQEVIIVSNVHYVYYTSTAVNQTVACAPTTHRARFWSPIGNSFLGEIFLRVFLHVSQMSESFRPTKYPNIIWPS